MVSPLAALLAPAAGADREPWAGEPVQGQVVVAVHHFVFREDGGAIIVGVLLRFELRTGHSQHVSRPAAITNAKEIKSFQEGSAILPPHFRQSFRVGREQWPAHGVETPRRIDRTE